MHGTYGHVKFKLDKEKDVSNHQNRNMTWLSMAEYLDKLASNKSDGLLMFDRSRSMPCEVLADIVRPVHCLTRTAEGCLGRLSLQLLPFVFPRNS